MAKIGGSSAPFDAGQPDSDPQGSMWLPLFNVSVKKDARDWCSFPVAEAWPVYE